MFREIPWPVVQDALDSANVLGLSEKQEIDFHAALEVYSRDVPEEKVPIAAWHAARQLEKNLSTTWQNERVIAENFDAALEQVAWAKPDNLSEVEANYEDRTSSERQEEAQNRMDLRVQRLVEEFIKKQEKEHEAWVAECDDLKRHTDARTKRGRSRRMWGQFDLLLRAPRLKTNAEFLVHVYHEVSSSLDEVERACLLRTLGKWGVPESDLVKLKAKVQSRRQGPRSRRSVSAVVLVGACLGVGLFVARNNGWFHSGSATQATAATPTAGAVVQSDAGLVGDPASPYQRHLGPFKTVAAVAAGRCSKPLAVESRKAVDGTVAYFFGFPRAGEFREYVCGEKAGVGVDIVALEDEVASRVSLSGALPKKLLDSCAAYAEPLLSQEGRARLAAVSPKLLAHMQADDARAAAVVVEDIAFVASPGLIEILRHSLKKTGGMPPLLESD